MALAAFDTYQAITSLKKRGLSKDAAEGSAALSRVLPELRGLLTKKQREWDWCVTTDRQ